MKLCSFLMPTRSGSFDMLHKAVTSILNAPGTDRDNLEILFRVDDDNTQRATEAATLAGSSGRVVIGPRGKGYNDMGVFVSDLVKVADSQWVWLFDDDSWVEGPWYGELKGMPLSCCACNAETYQLGPSKYTNTHVHSSPPGLIIPTGMATKIAHRGPVDDQWLSEIRRLNMPLMQLRGVTYHHDGRPRV